MVEGLNQLSDAQRQLVSRRWQVLAPYLQDGVPLTRARQKRGFRCGLPGAGCIDTGNPGWRAWRGHRVRPLVAKPTRAWST